MWWIRVSGFNRKSWRNWLSMEWFNINFRWFSYCIWWLGNDILIIFRCFWYRFRVIRVCYDILNFGLS